MAAFCEVCVCVCVFEKEREKQENNMGRNMSRKRTCWRNSRISHRVRSCFIHLFLKGYFINSILKTITLICRDRKRGWKGLGSRVSTVWDSLLLYQQKGVNVVFFSFSYNDIVVKIFTATFTYILQEIKHLNYFWYWKNVALMLITSKSFFKDTKIRDRNSLVVSSESLQDVQRRPRKKCPTMIS